MYTWNSQIPSRIIQDYERRNAELRKRPKHPLTGSLDNPDFAPSSQGLELSAELLSRARDLMKDWDGPVSQLNLMQFVDGRKDDYHKYGQVMLSTKDQR
jgi:hypothetical protein